MFHTRWTHPFSLNARLHQSLPRRLNKSLATGVNDRAACLWFALAILSFTPSFTAAVIWDKDRLLLQRESQQGMYSVTAWFAARTFTFVPLQVGCAACCIPSA